jgi:hypothetical protein
MSAWSAPGRCRHRDPLGTHSPLNKPILCILYFLLLAILFDQQRCLAEVVSRDAGEQVVGDLQVKTTVKEFYSG